MRLPHVRRGAAGQQYAIVVGLIAVLGILAVTSVGVNVRSLFTMTGNTMIRVNNESIGGGGAVNPGGPWTFTTCGASGHTGPTSCSYSGTLAGAVTVNAGYQLWSIPESGTYRITAYGAKGGGPTNNTVSILGGSGAVAEGEIAFGKGDKLLILVGQQGSSATYTGAGGGGTFVTLGDSRATSQALIVAGGGGGGNNSSYPVSGTGGCATTSGCGGQHGVNGSDGEGGSGGNSSHCGGGGGFKSGHQQGQACSNALTEAQGFRQGGVGHSQNWCGTVYDAIGGFGGGGSPGCSTGSGGGGYSGGRGMGGGGSFTSGANQSVIAASNAGDGRVVITYLRP